MIYHVLPGDSLAAEFKKANIDGDIIVCRECLIVGPIDAETPFEFWDERARFILTEYGEDEIEFHEGVADELEKLTDLDADAEVNLWFEYELFCSVNMWFCISRLKDSGAAVYRVEPSVLSMEDRWSGFGKLTADDLKECFDERKYLSAADITLGADLWGGYRKNDTEQLRELGRSTSDRFPYLAEVCEAAIEKNNKPKQILGGIIAEGIIEFHDIFPEFTRRAGVFGYGDLQVERLMHQL